MALDLSLKHLNKMWRGILFVLLGAASYGVLATVVKLAYNDGFHVAEVTFSQYSVGFVVLWLLAILFKTTKSKNEGFANTYVKKDVFKLIAAGTSLGFTGLFYYSAVQTIDVSICIVLLMQSVWMGVVLEAILEKSKPSSNKIVAVGLVLLGTIFATDAYSNFDQIDAQGLVWGFLAALSYTVSLYTANRVGLSLSNPFRSAFMMTGAWIVISIAMLILLPGDFNWSVFYPWGVYLALFGTIIPPIFLNKGFPLTGIGIGSILVSLEIPVSVVMAIVLLHENVNAIQIGGIVVILMGIVVLNINHLLGSQKSIEMD
jgi:drug/metabolite transporter (DMT)-like permease